MQKKNHKHGKSIFSDVNNYQKLVKVRIVYKIILQQIQYYTSLTNKSDIFMFKIIFNIKCC